VAQGCTAKAKKLPKLSPETKADIEAFEGKLEAAAAERREEQATAKAALQHSVASEDMVTHPGKPTACVVNDLIAYFKIVAAESEEEAATAKATHRGQEVGCRYHNGR